MSVQLDDDDLQRLYTWVDEVPLSRPKRHIARDFSDGVMMAELVHHYFPKLVEMHNYSNANSVRQKLYNWATLNQKVFRRLGFTVDKAEVDAVVSCKPSAIETVLLRLERHIADIRSKRPHMTFSPGGDGASPAAADGAAARGFGSGATASALHANDPYGAAASQQQFASAVSAAASSASRVGGSGASVAAPSAAHPAAAYAGHSGGSGSGSELVAEKDATIAELRETIEILELKIKKLEQLVRLKDSRIQTLTQRLGAGGAAAAPGGAGY